MYFLKKFDSFSTESIITFIIMLVMLSGLKNETLEELLLSILYDWMHV